jgi:hypothetical protein
LRHDVTVDCGLPQHQAGHRILSPAFRVRPGGEIGLQLSLGREEPLGGDGSDGIPGWRHPKLLGQEPANFLGGPGGNGMVGGPALQDGAPEQPFGAGHGEEDSNAHGTRGLAKDGDIPGITAEGRDVVANPFQGRCLVKQSDVGGTVAQVQEAVGTHSPVDHHADHAVPCEVCPVVGRRRADFKRAALDPDHNRQARTARAGCPDIEVQAVCAAQSGVPLAARTFRWSQLKRGRAVLGGIPNAAPGLNWLGRTEPVFTRRRRRIRNTEETVHTVSYASPQLALPGCDDGVHSCPSRVSSSTATLAVLRGLLQGRRSPG